MTQKDKRLLLKDLCARLPYGVICQYDCVHRCDTIVAQRINAQGKLMGIQPTFNGDIGFIIDHTKINALYDNVRPYLRSMSSMTEDERKELSNYTNPVQRTDFYYSHHIDCRFMIERGLALEAPEEMYKNK